VDSAEFPSSIGAIFQSINNREGHCTMLSSLSALPPALAVEEHDVLRDRVAPDAQFVGRKVGVGIADGRGAYDRKFRRNLELVANCVRITRHRDLHTGAEPSCRQSQYQRGRNMPTLRASAGPRSRCMLTMPTSGAPKKSKLRITAAVCLAVSAIGIPIEP
jgi:hypothetical protein